MAEERGAGSRREVILVWRFAATDLAEGPRGLFEGDRLRAGAKGTRESPPKFPKERDSGRGVGGLTGERRSNDPKGTSLNRRAFSCRWNSGLREEWQGLRVR